MTARSQNALTLFIETGLHAGTVQRLEPGLYTLGSELDADIVLADAGIEPVHLILELGRDGLRLEPLQGAVSVEGEAADLEPGGERNLAFPASFSIGEAVFKVSAPCDDVRSRTRLVAAMATTALLAIAITGLQIWQPFGGSVAEEASTLSTAALLPESETPAAERPSRQSSIDSDEAPSDVVAPVESDAPVESVAPDVPAVTLDQAARALRERLAAADLSGIEVKTAVDRLMIKGETAPERMADWQAIRIWFDGAFGRDVLLLADIEAAEEAEPPRLAIEAVWAGEDPYLIAGGRRFAVGAVVGDGWTIDRIGADDITFKRGDKVFSLTL